MIRLGNIVKEIYKSGNGYQQAILTNNPTELYFAERHEGAHVDILARMFPSILTSAKEFEKAGYEDENEHGENDALYAAANSFCEKENIVRVVIDSGKFIFNTAHHRSLTNSQIKFVKNYCIENCVE